MIRVMLLSTDLERGGLPMRIARMAPLLRDVGVEPIVGCLAARGPLADQLEQQGIETFACGGKGRFDASCLVKLAHFLRHFSPDILHSALFHANLAARLVGRLDRPRPIITTTVTVEIERAWHRWLESLTGGLSDLHVVNSQAVATHVVNDLGFSPDKIVVLPNAIAFDAIDIAPIIDRAEYGIAAGARLVVWAGRMDPVKDLTTFVDVIANVAKETPVVAVLLGDGPQRKEIEALIRSHKIENIVRVLGWRHDVTSWLKSADALLFTSLTEGSPNTLLEAIACVCPIVASDVPACRELVENSGVGRLCRPRDMTGFSRALIETFQAGRLAANQTNSAFLNQHQSRSVALKWGETYHHFLAGSHN